MQDIQFYLGNPLSLVPPPDNWQDLHLELSFENSSPDPVLNATELIWKGTNASLINTWYQDGLSGSKGIFEGIPFIIKIQNGAQVVFNGILDLTTAEFNCDIVKTKIADINIDRFNSLASGISFAYLATPKAFGGAGIIVPTIRRTSGILSGSTTGGDYIPILYQNNKPNDYFEIFITAYAIYNIVDKIEDALEKITDLVAAIAVEAATAGVGGLILDVFLLIAECIYLAFLIIVLYELVDALLFMIIPPPGHKLGMFVRDCFSSICNYFGFTFHSSIFASGSPYYNLVLMPEKTLLSVNYSLGVNGFMKQAFSLIGGGSNFSGRQQYDERLNLLKNPASSGVIGAYGYPDGSVTDFISQMEDVFNAKCKIIRNSSGVAEMHFERWDYVYKQSTYQLPNVSNEAPFKQTYSTNANEASANYIVEFQTDSVDQHTIENYNGVSCYYNAYPLSISTSINNVTLQNFTEKNLQFARATRKNSTTDLENVFGKILNLTNELYRDSRAVVNSVSKAINAGIKIINDLGGNVKPLPIIQAPTTSFSPSSYIGMMYLTNHTTSVPKLFIAGTPIRCSYVALNSVWNYDGITVDSGYTNSTGVMSATNLMKNFHYSSLLITKDPSGNSAYNQWIIYKGIKIPINNNDYQMIKNNNIIKTFDGRFARVDSLRWNMFTGMAEIDYRIQQKYTNNLSSSFVIDGSITKANL